MPFSNNLGAKEKNGRDWAYCKSLEWQMYSELAVPYFATSFGVASGQQHTNPHHCSHDPCSSQHIFLTFLVQLTNTQVFWKHIGHQDHQTFYNFYDAIVSNTLKKWCSTRIGPVLVGHEPRSAMAKFFQLLEANGRYLFLGFLSKYSRNIWYWSIRIHGYIDILYDLR